VPTWRSRCDQSNRHRASLGTGQHGTGPAAADATAWACIVAERLPSAHVRQLARETRVAVRLRAVEYAYRMGIERDVAVTPLDQTKVCRSPEHALRREMEPE
jgi:hypothetical protein